MAQWPGARMRDMAARETRALICDKWGFAPFEHQASWWAASDGLKVTAEREVCDTVYGDWLKAGNKLDWEPDLGFPHALEMPDGSLYWLLQDAEKRLYYSRIRVRLRGIATVLALLAAFKTGKSASTGLWTASFGLVDGFAMEFIGKEYDTTEPEFDYVREFLFSERGLGLEYDRNVKNVQNGDMELIVAVSGARFRSRSWKQAGSLEGKERDLYVYSEAYQLDSMMCYDGLSQNLDKRNGKAVFPTTRKKPWVEELHKHGHGGDPDFDHFHCSCDVDRSANPYTHDDRARRAAQKTMTRETYAIHWMGKPGRWLGSAYEFQTGDRAPTPALYEALGCDPEHPAVSDVVIPAGWRLYCGIDGGTHYSACFVVFDPRGFAVPLAEVTNYRYVSGEIEFVVEVSLERWARQVVDTAMMFGGRWQYFGDANLQMRRELRVHHGIVIQTGVPDLELRTDITREFFQHDRIAIPSWLEILPVELEKAHFPDFNKSTTSVERRVKKHDHVLDCLEHACGKRGEGKKPKDDAPASPIRELIGNAKRIKHPLEQWDPHLGA